LRSFIVFLVCCLAWQDSAPAETAGPHDSLVVAISCAPASLDPGRNTAVPIGSEIILDVFDTLVA
jgi:peptide/nickel transport system substrate-binding protein